MLFRSLDPADTAMVYFNPHAIRLKRLPEITPEQVSEGFGRAGLAVFTSASAMTERLRQERDPSSVLLLMSSGNYDGVDLQALGNLWVNQ